MAIADDTVGLREAGGLRPARVGAPSRGRVRRPVSETLLRRPGVITPKVGAATTALLYVSAGGSGLVARATDRSLSGPDPLFAVAAGGLVVGVLLFLVRARIRPGALHAIVAAGSLLIAAGVALAQPGSALGVASLWVFVAIDCVSFSWVGAGLQLLLVGAAATVSLDVAGVPGSWRVLTLTATLSVALAVGWLVRLADRAEVDPLTGLLNRRGFDRVLDTALAAAARGNAALSVAVLDLDHFKQLNDSLGHAAGDRVLTAVGHAWRGLGCPGELARVGGDEFVLVLPGPRAGAEEVVRRLRAGLPAGTTASAGVAELAPGGSRQGVLERADAALYLAKHGGRDRTDTDGGGPGGPERPDWEPVVDLVTGRRVGLELPVRWRSDPDHGGVTRRAFADAADWRTMRHDVKVAVDLDGAELAREGAADALLEAVAAAGLRPDGLVVEVCEPVLLGAAPAVVDALVHLRRAGVAVAVEDVTGRLGPAALAALPLDIVKLDRQLTAALAGTGSAGEVARVVVAAAAALRLDVVATGLDTTELADAARLAGARFGQGTALDQPAGVAGRAGRRGVGLGA